MARPLLLFPCRNFSVRPRTTNAVPAIISLGGVSLWNRPTCRLVDSGRSRQRVTTKRPAGVVASIPPSPQRRPHFPLSNSSNVHSLGPAGRRPQSRSKRQAGVVGESHSAAPSNDQPSNHIGIPFVCPGSTSGLSPECALNIIHSARV